jgi:ribose/xylose/arabinose/galactoside ABC-type transport system permease subunit
VTAAGVPAGPGPHGVPAAGAGTRPARWFLSHPDLPALGTLLAAVALFSLTADGFLSPTNLKGVALSVSVVAVVAVGQNLVILAGEIDVSVGSIFAVAATSAGQVAVATGDLGLTIAVGLGAGLAAGAVNGAVVALTGVPSIVATLGSLYAFRGLALLLSDNRNINEVPPGPSALGSGDLLGIPRPVAVVLVAFAVVALIRRNTVWGRDLIATGNNRRAALTMGVPVRRELFWAFAVSGLLAGLGAVVYLGLLGGAQTSVGTGLELQVIAACAIGGTSIQGGRGTDLAPLLGAVLIGVITNGVLILGVPGVWISCAYGACLLAAVAGDRLRVRLGRRRVG